jgi:DNA-binding XRE family transcriptional regulator
MNNPTPIEIKQARKKSGLTQTQAAEIIGKKYRIWQYYESGKIAMCPILFKVFNQAKKGSKK